MAIITLNNRSINRSDTASAGQVWTATSATAADFQGAGITEADMWRVTSGFSGASTPISSNWERADTDDFAVLGTGLGIFFAWSLIQALSDEGFDTFAISTSQTFIWIGIAIIAGIIAAIIPAIKASRQNILEAISYE